MKKEKQENKNNYSILVLLCKREKNRLRKKSNGKILGKDLSKQANKNIRKRIATIGIAGTALIFGGVFAHSSNEKPKQLSSGKQIEETTTFKDGLIVTDEDIMRNNVNELYNDKLKSSEELKNFIKEEFLEEYNSNLEENDQLSKESIKLYKKIADFNLNPTVIDGQMVYQREYEPGNNSELEIYQIIDNSGEKSKILDQFTIKDGEAYSVIDEIDDDITQKNTDKLRNLMAAGINLSIAKDNENSIEVMNNYKNKFINNLTSYYMENNKDVHTHKDMENDDDEQQEELSDGKESL